MRPLALSLLVLLLLGGCAEPSVDDGVPAPSSDPADEAGSSRASREEASEVDGDDAPADEPTPRLEVAPPSTVAPGAGAAPSAVATVPRAPSGSPVPGRGAPPEGPARRVAPEAFSLSAIDVDEGEDGHGHVVAAVAPIAVDIDAREFPIGALDPVLLVGSLRFGRYTYPEPGKLRFVCADASALPRDVPVRLQYGDDDRGAVLLAPTLGVTP